MTHHFNTEIAKIYGIEEAIIIDNLFFWIIKNEANGKNFFEGRYWTFNSVKSYNKLFIYMTESKIYRILNKLVSKDIIIKDNFNDSAFDRKGWYAFSDNGKSILENHDYHFSKIENGDNQNENTIADSKQQIVNEDTIKEDTIVSKKDCNDETLVNKQVDELYDMYPTKCPKRNVSLGKSFKDKDRIKKLLKTHSYEMLKFTIEQEISEKFNKAYMSNFSTFLNNLPDYGYVKSESNEASEVTDNKSNDININGVTYK